MAKQLFHHAPVENAALILKQGRLLSRTHSEGVRAVDVAPADLIRSRMRAHEYARLYFRPRTPTQFLVEGIRKPPEYYQGKHAPVLVMFVFDARSVLTMERVRFSDANMQSPSTLDGNTEAFFSAIDWESVYHNQATTDKGIRIRRCAEVLAPSPLVLKDHLQWVICRSQAERTMLLFALGSHASTWRSIIHVSDDMQVFEKRHTYVDRVALQEGGVELSLHPRYDGQTVKVRLRVWNDQEERIVDSIKEAIDPIPPQGKSGWIRRHPLKPGAYVVRIDLEGCCAYRARLELGEAIF